MTTISQETYDETLLENQELFDLSLQDAVAETILQFQQQGIQDLEQSLLTSHPHTPQGKHERNALKRFDSWLALLDSMTEQTDISDNELSAQQVEELGAALRGIDRFCAGCWKQSCPHTTAVSSMETDTGKETQGSEDVDTVSNRRVREDCDTDFMDSTSGTNSDHGLTYLTLFRDSLPIPKLMWCLKRRTNTDNHTEPLVHTATKTLISILTPRHPSERMIQSSIRDAFVAFDPLQRTIAYYCQTLEHPACDEACATTSPKVVILTDLIRLSCAVCRQCERNKVLFVRTGTNERNGGGIDGILQMLSVVTNIVTSLEEYTHTHLKNEPEPGTNSTTYLLLMAELCKLIAVLCRYDDFRPDRSHGDNGSSSLGMNVSSVHEHALEFHRQGAVSVLHQITRLLLRRNHRSHDVHERTTMHWYSVMSFVLNASRVLAVNDEIVQSLVAVGMLPTVRLTLAIGMKEEPHTKNFRTMTVYRQHVTAASLGLIRNLCGNDEIKTTLCLGSSSQFSTSILPSLLHAMRLFRFNACIQEHGCGVLAALALRKPANARIIMDCDGPRELLSAMRTFSDNVRVQRQGALAVRNIVSRLVVESKESLSLVPTKDLMTRDIFLDLGAEKVLREITGKHQGSVDEAYAALRDLGCQVSMVKYDAETGKSRANVEMFGDVKPQFRATY